MLNIHYIFNVVSHPINDLKSTIHLASKSIGMYECACHWSDSTLTIFLEDTGAQHILYIMLDMHNLISYAQHTLLA